METTAAPGAPLSAPPLPPLPSAYRTTRTNRTRHASRSCPRPESEDTLDAAPTRSPHSARSSDVPLKMIVNPRPSLKSAQQHRLPPKAPPCSFRDSPTKQFNSVSVMPVNPADNRLPTPKGGTPMRSMSMRVQRRTETKVGHHDEPGLIHSFGKRYRVQHRNWAMLQQRAALHHCLSLGSTRDWTA